LLLAVPLAAPETSSSSQFSIGDHHYSLHGFSSTCYLGLVVELTVTREKVVEPTTVAASAPTEVKDAYLAVVFRR